MTAIEDARAFLEPWGDIPDAGVPRAVRVVRALVAEHESLTALPTDDEREALAQVLWEAEVEHNPEGVTPGIESWEELCAEEPGWAEGYRHQAERSIAAGFRRQQAPITDEWERKTENRIHYRYGVNSGTYSAWPHGVTASHDEQQRRLESETSGPVDVTLRESRTVLYGPWEPVEAARADS